MPERCGIGVAGRPSLGRIPVLAILAAATACTGGEGGDATTTTVGSVPTTTVVATAPLVDLARAYVDGLAGVPGADPAAAAPGSDAARYAEHLRVTRELLGAGEAATVTAGVASYTVCAGDCDVYDAIVVDPTAGQVVTFAVDGVPLAGRISGDGPPRDVDGLVARVTTSYRTVGDDLLVVVEVANGTPVDVELFGFAAVFQPAAAGGAVEATGTWGDQVVPASATRSVLLAFPPSGPSGRVVVTALRGDGIDVELDLTVP